MGRITLPARHATRLKDYSRLRRVSMISVNFSTAERLINGSLDRWNTVNFTTLPLG
jgi:hypothetical protein